MVRDTGSDPEIAVCSECHSDQNINTLIKNPFFQSGADHIPCQFCKGRVIITRTSKRDASLRQADRVRGIVSDKPQKGE